MSSIHDSHYSSMQDLAVKVIELFSQTKTKTKPLIEEVTSLAHANNTSITRLLLKVLMKVELLDIDLLNALKTTLVNVLIEALDPDGLVQVLKITLQRITLIHMRVFL